MIRKFKDINKKLKKQLKSSRYDHTLGVAYTAAALAMKYEYDIEKAFLAGLLHDCAKRIHDDEMLQECEFYHIEITEYERKYPYLLHSKLGAVYAKELYDVTDADICLAITYHTTGREDMSLLEKIIFTADYIEPGRKSFEGMSEARKSAFEDIDLTVYKILESTIAYLESSRGNDIDQTTIMAYHYYQNLIDK